MPLDKDFVESVDQNVTDRRIGKQWLKTDTNAASEWIETSGHFNADQIAQLLKP